MSFTKSISDVEQVKPILKALRKNVPSFPVCLAGTVIGGVALGLMNWMWIHKTTEDEELLKGLDVDLEAVHRFYNEIQESPLLYPYFMHLKVEKREDVMQKIACSFHTALGQVVVAPEHLKKLKKIHNKLGVDEKAYAEFTKLFAHICCNKSDKQRARMLKMFAKLEKYICPGVVNQASSMVDFFKIPESEYTLGLSRSECRQQKQTVTQIQGLVDSESRDSWGEQAGEEDVSKQLYKQISELEKLLDYLVKVNKALDARMKVLESKNKGKSITKLGSEVSSSPIVNGERLRGQ